MRILELNFERTWRGGERQTLYNMQGFRNAGHDVSVLCRKGYPMEEKAQKEGFRTYSFYNIFGVIFFLLTKARSYNILHAQTSHILTYAIFTRPFHGCKIVFTRRVDFVPKGRFTKLKYRLTDSVVAISQAIKKILSEFSERDIDLVSEIFVKKDLDKTRAQRLADNAVPIKGKYIVGTTAALVQHKDPLTMVESIRRLSLLRNDFVFLHFGAGELEAAIKQKIEEYNLQDVYKMMGFIDNVEDVFSIFDVFVMSSEEEGLGSSILDAFIYKVPVVSTNAGGLIDLVKDGRGIVCNVKAPEEIANGIDTVLRNPGLKEDITERAQQYLLTEHSMEYITNKYLDIFRRLL